MSEFEEILPKNIKITFSKYCSSGYYGENCRCKICCKKQNKPYSELEEHRDWVYAKVMTGQPFIVDNVKPDVIFENNKPIFGKTYKYIYKGNIIDE